MDYGASSYRRFLDGDESGFVEIVRDYKDGLILYLNSFVNNLSVAEDLAEDTFVKLGIKRPKDVGGASFKTWLYTIGRNIAIDFMRRNKFTDVSIDDCAALTNAVESLEQSYIKKEDRLVLHTLMQRLKPTYRQVLWLVYFGGFHHKEVARIMKKSVHSIETLVYRARLSLKSELEKEGFVYENL